SAGMTSQTDLAPAPPPPALRVSNDHLDDPATLDRLLTDEGYLFFRNVLDVASVETARQAMMGVLIDAGLIDEDADTPRARPAGDEVRVARARHKESWGPSELDAEFKRRGIWQQFVRVPAVRAFFERVVGGAVGFAPIAEYRCRPPGYGAFWHQDGF